MILLIIPWSGISSIGLGNSVSSVLLPVDSFSP